MNVKNVCMMHHTIIVVNLNVVNMNFVKIVKPYQEIQQTNVHTKIITKVISAS